ncbi:formylglycine-generating enzyme family protein [Verrucomicrobiaceae bacterium 227]
MTSLRAIAIVCFLSLRLGMAAEEGEADVTMVSVPAGSYIPLYTVDKTPRKVEAFRLDVCPVTKREFLDFVRRHPRWQRSKISRLFADGSYLSDWKSDTDPGSDLDSPVTSVSWFAARAFAKDHGQRLPTVDEWEYVAQADATKANATEDPDYTAHILAWYAARPVSPLPSPTTFPKNFYGIRALHGLIWEWNEDFNNAMVTGESRGDSGLERNLFCAGGALSATDVRNYAAFMRYAFRSSLKGTYTTANLGFRCAANVPEPTP